MTVLLLAKERRILRYSTNLKGTALGFWREVYPCAFITHLIPLGFVIYQTIIAHYINHKQEPQAYQTIIPYSLISIFGSNGISGVIVPFAHCTQENMKVKLDQVSNGNQMLI